MKKLLTAAVLTALLMSTGCATSSITRNYTITATGYTQIEGDNVKAARQEAASTAKQNLIYNLQKFMEYKLPISPELTQKVIYGSTVAGEGRNQEGYYVTMAYNLDLYNFVAQNCDFKNVYTWQLLGMEKYFSDYMNSNLPIGIWTQKSISKEKRPDTMTMAMLSVIPCYSGNFALGKNIEGGFFSVLKLTALLTAIFHPQSTAKIWACVGLAGATAFDVYSVFYEVNSMNQRLELFEDAVMSDNNFEFKVPITGKKF
jgi:hypothetical protein